MKIQWYNRIQVRIFAIFFILFVLIVIMMAILANTFGLRLMEDQAYVKLSSTGHLVVSELEGQTNQIAILTNSLANIASKIPADNEAFAQLIKQFLNIQSTKELIAGGGIWPEPFKFDATKERNSYFWGRDINGRLEYFDDYNLANGTGYHHEEWYVPTQHISAGDVYWSKSYTDPYSLQPMVTASVPMIRNGENIGAATIDLKLDGIQAILRDKTSDFDGYAFVVDRDGRFLSFPDTNLVRYPKVIKNNNSLIPFAHINDLTEQQPEFKPIAKLLDLHAELLKENDDGYIDGRNEFAAQLAADSYQITVKESLLISAILFEQSGAESQFNTQEYHVSLGLDYFLQEPAFASIILMPKTFWRVVTVMPSSVAYHDGKSLYQLFFTLTVVSILFAMTLVWFLLRQNLTKPVTSLAHQLILSTQDDSQTTKLIESDHRGELGVLIHWFNRRTEQLLESQQKIEHLAFFDALTSLPNRRMLLSQLHKTRESSLRLKSHGAVFFLDLDHFKTLNDSLGHSVGDQLLVQVAKRLSDCVRISDMVARIGGDEFVVLITTDPNSPLSINLQAANVADKIIKRMEQAFKLEDSIYHVTTSIGISLFPNASQNVEDIIKQADTAMYAAKKKGRNDYCFFEDRMQLEVDEKLRIQEELRDAIDGNELHLLFQPQVDINGVCQSVEALVRWHHPNDGVISPAVFIPVAEESLLIIDVGRWVMNEACRQIYLWNEQGIALSHIAVNVSPRQFDQTNFIEDVQIAIAKNKIDPQQLMVEITEGVVLEDTNEAIEKMKALRHMGVIISMDDFGTGYSSLAYLKSLPLDQLKIDQSFIKDITMDLNDSVIVETIISLAHQFGYQVIAEGVETVEQRQILINKGCEYFQGYYFSHPLDSDALELYLRDSDGK